VSKGVLLGIFLGAFTPLFSQATSPTGTATAGTAPPPTLAPISARRLVPENTFTRVYCVVPFVGSGTAADPKRPMFAPPPATPTAPLDRAGIIAFQYQTSDDGNSALVEFVAVSQSGLAPILTSTNPNVIAFLRGNYTRQQIETVFQKYKKNFSFSNFMPVRAQ